MENNRKCRTSFRLFRVEETKSVQKIWDWDQDAQYSIIKIAK